MAHTSSLGLIVAIVVIYTQRDVSVYNLERRSLDFVTTHMRRALERVTVEVGDQMVPISIGRIRHQDIFGYQFPVTWTRRAVGQVYGGEVAGPDCTIWVGFNVHRIFMIYFIDRPSPERLDELLFKRSLEKNEKGMIKSNTISSAEIIQAPVERNDDPFISLIKEIFSFTFGGAEKVGFHVNYEPALIQGKDIVSIWASVQVDPELLMNPGQKLFWANDVAMMTESFLRTALRNSPYVQLSQIPARPL